MAGRKGGVAKKRLDKFYHLAKERGYRSRAAFKLVQLNKKFDFLSGARGVLDLCAAPGSWLQVAREYMPVSGVLVGVDLVPIKAVPRAVTLVEDITTDKCRAALKKQFKDVRVDVVMHDGAPNVGQAWLKDAYGQSELVLASLKLGAQFLAPGGWFVTKVFRSQDYNALLWVFNQLFDKVEATKPQASRNESAEIFVVCSRFTSAKIDPRLFDPKCVFSDLTELKAANALQVKHGYKAPALGYEKDDYTLYHTLPITAFVKSEAPIRVLSEKNALDWDETGADEICAFYNAQIATTDEIKRLCTDLKVLGKGDLRTLLKWRLKMRARWREAREAEAIANGEAVAEGAPGAADPEVDALGELEELAEAATARERTAVRKAKVKLGKSKERLALKMELPGDRPDLQEDIELFSLNRIKSAGALDAVLGDEDNPITADWVIDEEEKESHGAVLRRQAQESALMAEAEADATYESRLDNELDEMYEQYKSRSRSKAAQQRELANKYKKDAGIDKRLREESAKAKQDSDDEEEEEENPGKRLKGARNPLLHNSGDSEEEEPDDEQLDGWFDQPLFAGIAAEKAAKGKPGKRKADAYQSEELTDDDEEEVDDDDEDDDSEVESEEEGKGEGMEVDEAEGEEEEEEENSETDSEAELEEDLAVSAGPGRTRTAAKPAVPAARKPTGKPAATSARVSASTAYELRAGAAAIKATSNVETERAAARAAAVARALASGKPLADPSDSEGDDDGDLPFIHHKNPHAASQAKLMREAERIALGQALIRPNKRKDLIDGAYNRHTFADKHLPEWFMDDERKVTRSGVALVDAESLNAAADALQAVDARSIGKVVEAKARKKRRMAKMIEKLKKTAEVIVDKGDMSEREKGQAIEKLYKGKLKNSQKRPSAKLVVTGKGGKAGVAKATKGAKSAGNGKIKNVDKRMLKDKRGEKRVATKGKGAGSGGGKNGKGGGKGVGKGKHSNRSSKGKGKGSASKGRR